MLVLTRKNNETIIIDEKIVVKVIDVRGNTVRIGIEAPQDVNVRRAEVPFVPRMDDAPKT